VPFDGLKLRLIDLKKVAFSVRYEAGSDFKVLFVNLIHRLFDFIQIAILAGQEAEIGFAMPCNH